ncbi:hypothetical protein ACFPVY_03490 [Flavobacterium qiangtangense]|uniref:Uncharacterized protein n=1 Tax=Flavobacterium qiangtangense TaxID=1442595 RepID=A0ABW1PKH8_9FLAO
MNIIDRATKPTPKFFKSLRTFGLILFAVSSALLGTPIVLPTLVLSVAGYLAVAGSVIAAVSQVTIEAETNGTKKASPRRKIVKADGKL